MVVPDANRGEQELFDSCLASWACPGSTACVGQCSRSNLIAQPWNLYGGEGHETPPIPKHARSSVWGLDVARSYRELATGGVKVSIPSLAPSWVGRSWLDEQGVRSWWRHAV